MTLYINTALSCAQQAVGLSEPNPRVGCVLTSATGEVIGLGHTQRVGGPHAEIEALRDAQARSASTQGATAYVTLEPCSHHGRTPPCCDALVAAGRRAGLTDAASLEKPDRIRPTEHTIPYARDLTLDLEPYSVAVVEVTAE